jgi:Platelet-activating factor acetylhydrolase, isoform II
MKYKRYLQRLCAPLFMCAVATSQVSSPAQPRSSTDVFPVLPVPSGPYAIGRQGYDLMDMSRTDPFSLEKGRNRELMIYVWYPAKHSNQQSAGEYFPHARVLDKDPEGREAAKNEFGPRWPQIVSGSITSHAIVGGSPLRKRGKFPVVLFSHGISDTTFSSTAQIEDFASHGYVVVAIEHTDAAGVVLFPDGRVRLYREDPTPSSPPKDPSQAMIASAQIGTETGAEDVRFVLNRLEDGAIPLSSIMDLKRVAAVGRMVTISPRSESISTPLVGSE